MKDQVTTATGLEIMECLNSDVVSAEFSETHGSITIRHRDTGLLTTIRNIRPGDIVIHRPVGGPGRPPFF